MPITKAQLMATPGGPGIVGSVKAGTGINISADGTASVDPTQTVTRIIAGSGVSVNPSSGFGDVSVSVSFASPEPPPVLGGSIPPNKTTFFCQSSAPTGWTQNVSNSNSTLRIVNSSPSNGGSVPVSSLFSSIPVSGSASGSNFSTSFTLQNADIPVSGSINGVSGTVDGTTLDQNTGGTHTHGYFYSAYGVVQIRGGSNPMNNVGVPANYVSGPQNEGSGEAHSHAFQNGSGTFNGNNISHGHTASANTNASFGNFSGGSINLAVKYVDLITAYKN
jgi:hypothetical protein